MESIPDQNSSRKKDSNCETSQYNNENPHLCDNPQKSDSDVSTDKPENSNLKTINPENLSDVAYNSENDSSISKQPDIQLDKDSNEIFSKKNTENDSNLELTNVTEIAENFSVVLSYASQNRPRQPFMSQPTNQQNTRDGQRLPAPPPYYSQQVTGQQHQPQMLRQRNSDTNRPQEEVVYNNQPMFQGNMVSVIPNALLTTAYWAPYPTNIPSNIPACLAHLVAADSLFIIQKMDLLEIILNLEEANFYLIQNRNGQCLYYAYETSEFCAQTCCRNARSFQLHIMDMYHNEIIYMNRPCGCTRYICCYPFIEIYSPPLVPVGAVLKTFHPTDEVFWVLDADENKMFKIHGPCFVRTFNCCMEAEFTIHALDEEETEIGIIKREWGGYVTTFFTNADFYGITFPVDLDVRVKSIFLGALFLIDYAYFESS